MRTYTAIEAARELSVSEKTIRRWIEDNKLQATKTASGRLAISEGEIERVKLEREQDGTNDQDQAARLEELERKYSDLEQKYTALVARVASLEDQPTTRTSASGRTSNPFKARQPGAPSSLELFSASTLVPPNIPDGSMQYADFAQMHGMNPHTFRDHLTVGIGRGEEIKDKVEHLERPIPNRSERERWLSPDQQYAAVLFWQRHGKKYIPCAQCPHRPEQVSVTPETTAQDGDSAAIEDRDL